MVYIEKIELCYNASPDLEWVATEEARRLTGVYEKLKQLPISVGTYLHQWRFSSELIFYIQGEAQPLEEGLRMLYSELGLPANIAKTLVCSPSSRRAIEISEGVISELKPDFDKRGFYVDSCSSRGYPSLLDMFKKPALTPQ